MVLRIRQTILDYDQLYTEFPVAEALVNEEDVPKDRDSLGGAEAAFSEPTSERHFLADARSPIP